MAAVSVDPTALFRALSDQTRLRCLQMIRVNGEVCVCDFTDVLVQSQPKISRHLAYLRSNGVVQDRRVRTMVFYRFSDQLPGWAVEVLNMTLSSIASQQPFVADLDKLSRVQCRGADNGAPD